MNVVGDFVIGMVSVLKTVGAPLLYRYPYRNSGEGIRSDWLSLGKDIDNVIGQLKSEKDHERTN